MTRALVLVMLAACSAPATTQVTSSPPPPPPPPPAAGCPASFAQATGACALRSSCTYPEGTCSCGYPQACGGAARAPDLEPPSWQCTPTTRADGCPGSTAQGPCRVDGKVCDYTCSCVLTATCRNGQWQVESGVCKP